MSGKMIKAKNRDIHNGFENKNIFSNSNQDLCS
jgi:hypothetical protein